MRQLKSNSSPKPAKRAVNKKASYRTPIVRLLVQSTLGVKVIQSQ